MPTLTNSISPTIIQRLRMHLHRLLANTMASFQRDSVDQKLIYEKKLKDRTTKMKNHFEYEVR